MSNEYDYKIVFFGTPQISVFVLEELEKGGIVPSLVVTTPDKPQGRKMVITPSETKVWAQVHSIPVLQPDKIDDEFLIELKDKAPQGEWDVFVVAAYGKFLPKSLLKIPKHEVLNVHPSLLPQLRGANPIRGAILADEKEIGVTIMLVDNEMDHGPMLAQDKIEVSQWPPHASELEEKLARHGGKMLAGLLPKWIKGEITPTEQDHSKATLTKKITKKDGLINLDDDPYQNLLKIRAYEGWPGTYFFVDEKRIKIIDAEIENNKLKIIRIIPEGKNEINYSDFIK